MPRRQPLVLQLVCAALFVSTLGHALADDPRDADVDKDMALLKTAMIAKDQATLIDMMYKPVVAAAGGRDHLLAQTKDLVSAVETTEFETNKPFQYYTGKDNDYVIVPTRALMTIKGRHYQSISFELGVKSHQGGSWQYVDGAGINPQARSVFFTDLPSDVVFPDHNMKPLD